MFALLFVSSFAFAAGNEVIDWSGYTACKTGLNTIQSDAGLIDVPFRASGEDYSLLLTKRDDNLGVYIVSFSRQLTFFAPFPNGPQGVGISNLSLNLQVPGTRQIPLVLGFSDAQWVTAGFSNPDLFNPADFTPVTAQPVLDFQFHFSLELAFEAAIDQLPDYYLTGVVDGPSSQCFPKATYLSVLQTCNANGDLSGEVSETSKRFQLISDASCQ